MGDERPLDDSGEAVAPEGGNAFPPSDSLHSTPEESRPESSPEIVAEVLFGDIPLPEDRAAALRAARRMLAWSGPLPATDDFSAYELVLPGTARAIVDDFTRRSELDAEAARHEMAMQSRQLALQERNASLREAESVSDRDAR